MKIVLILGLLISANVYSRNAQPKQSLRPVSSEFFGPNGVSSGRGSTTSPVGGGAAKITCPCSCQCPAKITVINGVRHCPTECLLGTSDGTSTNVGL